MAGPLVDVGTGATLTFSSTSYTSEIVSINATGRSRVAVDVTKLSSTANEHIRGDLIEPGQYEIEMHYQPDNPPPIFGTTSQENFVLTFPIWGTQQTGAKEAVAGFIQSVDGPNVGVDEKMVVTVTVKLSGAVSQTDGL